MGLHNLLDLITYVCGIEKEIAIGGLLSELLALH